ncbi:MAG: hypothetical protein QM296_11820 [Bacillota bacterium]|nr:hypothetical protein [Bacillota bacterium]
MAEDKGLQEEQTKRAVPVLEAGSFSGRQETAGSPALRSRLPLLVAGVAFLVLLLFGLLWQSGRLRRLTRSFSVETRIPSSLANRDLRGAEVNRDRLINRLTLALENDEGVFAAGRWLDAASGRFYDDPEAFTRSRDLSDLLLLAAESGDRELFDRVWRSIETRLQREDGVLMRAAAVAPVALSDQAAGRGLRLRDDPVPEAELEEARRLGQVTERECSMQSSPADRLRDDAATLRTLRALIIAYDARGDGWLLTAIRELSDAWLAHCDGANPPPLEDELYSQPQPTPYVEAAEGRDADGRIQDEDWLPLVTVPADSAPGVGDAAGDSAVGDSGDEPRRLELIRLADLDLEALRLLQSVDARYEAIYKRSLELLSGAALDRFPWSMQGYDAGAETYVAWIDDPAWVLEDQMAIWLALASQNCLDPGVRPWLMARVREGPLAERYDLAGGAALDAADLPLRYGQLLRLHRWADDADPWRELLTEVQRSRIGTVSTSPLLGLVFRRVELADIVRLALADNVWLLLGAG